MHILLVEQVVHVQLQIKLIGHLVADHGVVHPVGVQLGVVAGGHVTLAGITCTVTHAPAGWQLVGAPQVERARRGVTQRLTFTGDTSSSVCGLEGFAVEEGVVGVDVPLIGNPTGHTKLNALHTLLTRQLSRAIGHGFTGVGLLDTEQRSIQLQAVIEQLPLGAQLPGFVLFRIQLGGSSSQRTGRRQVLRRRVEGRTVSQVDAAILGRFVDHPGTATEFLVTRIHTGHGAGRQRDVLRIAFDPVVTQAQAQVPLLVQGQGVEDINRFVIQLGAGFSGASLVDRPGVITWRVTQIEAAAGEIQAIAVSVAVVILTRNLNTRHQGVTQAEGVEIRGQVGLVDPHLAGHITAIALRTGRPVLPSRGDGQVDVGGRNDRITLDLAVTAEVLQAQVVVEVVFKFDRKGVGLNFFLVDVLPAEEALTLNTGQALAVESRYAVIGHVVIVLMQVAEGQASRLAQPQQQRRRNTPALAIHMITAWHIVLMGHQVETKRAVGAHTIQGLVGVQGQAVVVVGAQAGTDFGEVALTWLLAGLIDAAAGGAGAAEYRVGAFDDLNGFDIEGVGTVVLRAVAQAVDLHVGVGTEATDVDAVARTTTALTGVKGDTGDVGQHFFHAQGFLLLEQRLRYHGDGLRGIEQRRRVLGGRRGFGLVAFGLLALDRHATQFDRCLGLLRHLLGCHAGTRPRRYSQTDGRSQKTTLRQVADLFTHTHENHPQIKTRRDSI